MNIAIDIRCLMDKNRSGVGEYTYNLLKNLFEIDKKNYYFLFYNSFKKIKLNLPRFEFPHVRFLPFNYPNKLFNLMLCFGENPKIDELIFKKYKISIDLFFLPNLNFIALGEKCRKITVVHDLSFISHSEFYSLKRQIWHYLVATKKLFSDSEKIICVSQNTKNDLLNFYKIAEEKAKVVYSGITEDYKKIKVNDFKLDQLKKKYDLPNNFIFSLGTLEPRKNIIAIISAFEKINIEFQNENLYLVIAGNSGWKYQSIFNLAKKSKKRYFIKFLNYVEPCDKIYLYNLAKAFVFPSIYEGFGFPPLEAMACETPVIASNNSCFPEILGDSALLVNPYNISEIRLALNLVLKNQELRENLIAKGKEQVKKYSWKNCAKEVLSVLENNL